MTSLALLLAWTAQGPLDEVRALAQEPEKLKARLQRGLDQDEFQDAAAFRQLASLYPVDSGLLHDVRVPYEMLLTALALGDSGAREQMPLRWDFLMISAGRQRQFIAPEKSPFPIPRNYQRGPLPEVVRRVWQGQAKPGAANVELKKLFDADQGDRQNMGPTMDQKAIIAMVKRDAERLKRTRQIVQKGELRHADDFYYAAFIFQHSDHFEDYALAHTLAVSSRILGRKDASWIAGASYDRMMLSASYPQRFGTQFRGVGGKYTFQWIDETFMNDRQRKAVIGRTLAEARKVFEQ